MTSGQDCRLKVASQLGGGYDRAVQAEVGDLFALTPIPRGTLTENPGECEALFAYPFHRAGQAPAPRPAGWPWDITWVQLLSSGLDAYPDWLFDGPVVTSARGTLAIPIAEFCMAVIFAAAKRLPEVWIDNPHDWALKPLDGLEGRTLGLFGFGAIGEAIARRALAFGMDVCAVRASDRPMIDGVRRVDGIDDLLAVSDHLVLAAPAGAGTDRVISTRSLTFAKPGLHLVNVARGALIDDAALLAALDDGRISLASLDVTDPEPLPVGHPFYTHPRIRLSPHTSVMVPDAQARVAAIFAANVRRRIAGEPLLNIVERQRAG
jgi:phosphoglycerate dehydrogenase-like enzyme